MDRRPVTLLMTADAVGGIWTYAIDLAGAFAAAGTNVTLAVVGPGLDAGKRHAATRAGVSVIDLGHPPEWLAEGPDAVARGGAALAALAREVAADLIHLNHPALGADADLGCPTLAVCHSCVTTWWEAVRGTPLPRDLAWQADIVARGCRAATALAAPSHAFAQATQRAYRLERPPSVVFNGRSAGPMSHGDRGTAEGLTVGRLWDEGKDVATLDRAAALSRHTIRAVGPLAGPNGATVALRHLDATGPVGDAQVRDLLARRPVYLSAARYEPFGLSVLEAAQAGCPLVLSDIPTFRELWGEAALFVAPGDATGFAAAFDRVVNDPPLGVRLGDAARERATRFTLEAAVERLADIYATLLGRPVAAIDAGSRVSRTPRGGPAAQGGEAA